MKPLTYEENVRLNPMSATQAELHDFCKWLTEERAQEDGKNDYSQGRIVAYTKVVEKLKFHDLWVN